MTQLELSFKKDYSAAMLRIDCKEVRVEARRAILMRLSQHPGERGWWLDLR